MTDEIMDESILFRIPIQLLSCLLIDSDILCYLLFYLKNIVLIVETKQISFNIWIYDLSITYLGPIIIDASSHSSIEKLETHQWHC